MSTPFRYHADPSGQNLGELEGPSWMEAARQQLRPKPLWEVIPDDPNYQKYIPIEYRLNATRIVGYLAQDLQQGQSAHVWLELAHLGIDTAEAIFESSELIGLLGLASPAFALAASFAVLGVGYQEAWEEIAEKSSASGYSRGVVMGADGRSSRLVGEYFGNLFFSNPVDEHAIKVEKASHDVGLVVGHLHGRVLRQNQRTIFWHDLGRRLRDQSGRGPTSQWSSKDWRDWYTDVAIVFRRDHLTA